MGIQKSQRERENMQSEMEVLLDRINKMSAMLDKPSREKEDVIIEMERNKEELSKEKTSNKILNEEKDMNNKEFERLLEKYDRSQGDLYRIQGKLEASTNDQERLSLEVDKANIISNKQKDDHKKLLEEFNGLQDIYDKTAVELTKTKEMEIKLKEDHER